MPTSKKYVVVIIVDGNLRHYEVWAYNIEDAQDDALAQALFDGTKIEMRGAYLSGSMPDEPIYTEYEYDC